MAVFSSALSKRHFNWTDAIVLIFVILALYSTVSIGASMNAPFSPDTQIEISLSPAMLPYYAGRSLLRMFIAFGASLLFALVYGYAAAKSRTAGKLLIPLLDMLQSIPVLGFLSATITTFMVLFPGSLLGVELASILAIFTGQAWNMAFSFYHSLVTIPKDLQEAAHVLRLNWWQRFIRLEVPFSMIGLVWNSMMSFGGGWFFLAASEAISVLGQDIRLPGVGSYLATAIDSGNIEATWYSIITMVLMIVVVDQLFWRPLIAYSQKFKIELVQSADVPTSWVYNLLKRSKLITLLVAMVFAPIISGFSFLMDKFAAFSEETTRNLQTAGIWYWFVNLGKIAILLAFLINLWTPAHQGYLLLSSLNGSDLLEICLLGLHTFIRVLIAVALGALWAIPAGVAIGLHPRLARITQPVVQVAASFPANMLFPFITVFFLTYHINFDWGSIALMMLGTQWYILFNVIAGAMSIPNDLLEAGSIFKLQGWHKWKTLILPSIFPHLITGIITASGGAWNASIVSEYVSWHDQQLIANGLGAYISRVTEQGDWAGIIWGITVMCILVTLVNRLVWRRLYQIAETKYHLD